VPVQRDTHKDHPEQGARNGNIDKQPKRSDPSREEPGGKPAGIPEHLKPKGPSDSTDAASEALRRHFGQ
jgi:hypothetical protein